MYISFGSGRCEINIKYQDAEMCSHSGDCEADIRYLAEQSYIKAQIDKIDKDTIRDELKEYGAWDVTELADNKMNIIRMLWILCGNVTEEYYSNGKRRN